MEEGALTDYVIEVLISGDIKDIKENYEGFKAEIMENLKEFFKSGYIHFLLC